MHLTNHFISDTKLDPNNKKQSFHLKILMTKFHTLQNKCKGVPKKSIIKENYLKNIKPNVNY